jgi:hypothetical protein
LIRADAEHCDEARPDGQTPLRFVTPQPHSLTVSHN